MYTNEFDVPVGAIIKACDYCNLNCDGCYYLHHMSSQNRPHPSHVTNILRASEKIIKHNNRFSAQSDIRLHGGEPCLLGIKPLNEIIDGIPSCAATSLVTNLAFAHLNDRWLAVLERFDHIGISLNGDARGNAGRVFKSGKPSFGLVTDNLQILRKAKLNNYGLICTVTKDNIDLGYETIVFLHSLVTDIKIIPMDEPNFPPDRLADFLIDALRAYIDINDNEFRCSIIDEGLRVVCDGDPKACALSKEFHCHHPITIRLNGDVFPCDSAGSLFLKAGNIFENELSEILTGPIWPALMEKFIAKKKGALQCAAIKGDYTRAWIKYLQALGNALN